VTSDGEGSAHRGSILSRAPSTEVGSIRITGARFCSATALGPATRASHDAALVALTVQRAPGPGDVPSEVDFDVLAEGEVVGRLMVAELSSGLGTVWLWTIDPSHRDRRFPNHGYEATREAAMQAFAKSWHREA
jgi:hypothetical protein